MIVFFGPAGAGKSLQGQILAARHNWRWLSAGQLLRDKSSNDEEIATLLKTGNLLPPRIVNGAVSDALDVADKNGIDVILDGYPRSLDQAKFLTARENNNTNSRKVNLAIALVMPMGELQHRLAQRGRIDDTPNAIARRLEIFQSETKPVLDYYRELGVPVVDIDGVGTVGEVHDRIEKVFEQYVR
jgi:adenylate kinase